MAAEINTIASWDEIGNAGVPDGSNSIATEPLEKESPEWEVCLDALLRILADPSSLSDPRPNAKAIKAAIAAIAYLRTEDPGAPPTCIIPEPGGGIIVERRSTCPEGDEWVREFTFYNAGNAEFTEYRNGKVLRITPIPLTAPAVQQGAGVSRMPW